MDMSQTNQIDKLLDEAGNLSFEEQEALLEILQKRLLEARRTGLAKDVQDAGLEFEQGKCTAVDAEKLFKEIIS